MDGTYEITMLTPVGSEKGNISFHSDGESFTGKLKIMGNAKDINGSIQDGTFTFSSELRNLLTRITFTATGKTEDGKLNATAASNFGEIKISGKKIKD